jgi:DNA segregation ATPase FtsK/SpoIIIE, S-DNA-T family
MATVVVRRPPRRPAPPLPAGELILEAPPEIPQPQGRNVAQMLMVLPMIGGSAATALLFTSGSGNGAMGWLVAGLLGLSAVGMLGMGFMGGGGRREMAYARRQYLRQLAQHRVRVDRVARQQRGTLWYLHPDPDELWSVAASYRLWERRRHDPDFCVARIGLGPQALATALVAPATKSLESLEPMSALALRRFITTYSALPDMPAAMAVNGFSRIYVTGYVEVRVGLVRAILAQLAVFHAPDDLIIAVCAAQERRHQWEWLKWLPHALHPEDTDALGQARLITSTITAMETMLHELISDRPRFDESAQTVVVGPQIVIVVDEGDLSNSEHLLVGTGIEGVTVLDLTSPPPRALDRAAVVLNANGNLVSTTMDGHTELGRADYLAPVEAEMLARQLAPLRLPEDGQGETAPTTMLSLADLLGIDDPETFEPDTTWVPRPNRERLRVRFGLRSDGSAVELDLKEAAQDGMGPHGLLIGATGSGKSELLRTLVLGLAVRHAPGSLNFVLVDFKGGATFATMDRLPHTSALITNLAEELTLVDRMTDSLEGEMLRRQELLRGAGNFASLRDYERARVAGAPLAEVPVLLVVCDEFSELLEQKPDFIDMFVKIGRLGRSLGVHLLLASQRLEEGRLRGLDVHLSYRIGLRTFSAIESRVVLGVGDAYELPPIPGHGLMKFGTESMTRFRAAYVSGVYRPSRTDAAASTGGDGGTELRDYTSEFVEPDEVDTDEPGEPQDEAVEEDDEAVGETIMDLLVDRMTERGVPAHQIWLPPLKESEPLDVLLPALEADPGRGFTVPAGSGLHGMLRAVVGLQDRPLEQRRDRLVLDLSAGAGHAVVVGGPQTGKSTLLRILITSLALTHTPLQVQFYCLDFGGGALGAMRELPHVGGVADRRDGSAVRRTVADVSQVLRDREERFAQHRIDGMADYRRAWHEGRFGDDQYGDVFLVIDGWLTLRNEFDDLEDKITDLATRGLSYGVHVVASCARWFDLRPGIRDLFGTRLELRLGDPADSFLHRKAAANVPAGAPGRGITDSGHQILIGLPRIDGRASTDDLSVGVEHLVTRVATGWPMRRAAPPVRELPARVGFGDLPRGEAGRAMAIGLSEQDLGPVYLWPNTDPHFLLFGDTESGKTNFLRVVAQRVVEAYPPERARVLLVDYRRGLLGAVSSDHLVGYGTSMSVAATMIGEVAQAMAQRLPGPDVTAEQLRSRSWWTGSELFLLVDDYDLVAGGSGNPLTALIDYLPQARDIGLHVILARRSGGAGRAMFDPVIQALKEIGTPGVVLSGDRDEGPLLGTVRPSAQPPGRGRLVGRRGDAQLVQLAWLPPPE